MRYDPPDFIVVQGARRNQQAAQGGIIELPRLVRLPESELFIGSHIDLASFPGGHGPYNALIGHSIQIPV